MEEAPHHSSAVEGVDYRSAAYPSVEAISRMSSFTGQPRVQHKLVAPSPLSVYYFDETTPNRPLLGTVDDSQTEALDPPDWTEFTGGRITRKDSSDEEEDEEEANETDDASSVSDNEEGSYLSNLASSVASLTGSATGIWQEQTSGSRSYSSNSSGRSLSQSAATATATRLSRNTTTRRLLSSMRSSSSTQSGRRGFFFNCLDGGKSLATLDEEEEISLSDERSLGSASPGLSDADNTLLSSSLTSSERSSYRDATAISSRRIEASCSETGTEGIRRSHHSTQQQRNSLCFRYTKGDPQEVGLSESYATERLLTTGGGGLRFHSKSDRRRSVSIASSSYYTTNANNNNNKTYDDTIINHDTNCSNSDNNNNNTASASNKSDLRQTSTSSSSSYIMVPGSRRSWQPPASIREPPEEGQFVSLPLSAHLYGGHLLKSEGGAPEPTLVAYTTHSDGKSGNCKTYSHVVYNQPRPTAYDSFFQPRRKPRFYL